MTSAASPSFTSREIAAALVPGYAGGVRRAAIPDRAWDFFLAHWLDRSQPAVADSYKRACEAAAAGGWGELPSVRTFERRVQSDIPLTVRILEREGERELAKAYPGDPEGLLKTIGVERVQWTNPDKVTGNPGAKPVERAFQEDFADPTNEVRKLAQEQREILILAVPGAGSLGRPRYWSADLARNKGRQLTAYYDPEDLKAPRRVPEPEHERRGNGKDD